MVTDDFTTAYHARAHAAEWGHAMSSFSDQGGEEPAGTMGCWCLYCDAHVFYGHGGVDAATTYAPCPRLFEEKGLQEVGL